MVITFLSLTQTLGDICFSTMAVDPFQNTENLQHKHESTYGDIESISGIQMETAYYKFDLSRVTCMRLFMKKYLVLALAFYVSPTFFILPCYQSVCNLTWDLEHSLLKSQF